MHATYYCDVQDTSEINSYGADIDEIDGIHHPFKSIRDVKGFFILHKTVEYFPKGIDKFFNNLLGISIRAAHLREIHQHDLKPFSKLQYLNFQYNKIKVIEADLFKFNPDLELIRLSHNSIANIDPYVFNGLDDLNTLALAENACLPEVNVDVENNRQLVRQLVNKIQNGKCSDRLDIPQISCSANSCVIIYNKFENYYTEKKARSINAEKK